MSVSSAHGRLDINSGLELSIHIRKCDEMEHGKVGLMRAEEGKDKRKVPCETVIN